jgi:hypothetical protein
MVIGSPEEGKNEWSRNPEVTRRVFPWLGELQQSSLRGHLAQHGNS